MSNITREQRDVLWKLRGMTRNDGVRIDATLALRAVASLGGSAPDTIITQLTDQEWLARDAEAVWLTPNGARACTKRLRRISRRAVDAAIASAIARVPMADAPKYVRRPVWLGLVGSALDETRRDYGDVDLICATELKRRWRNRNWCAHHDRHFPRRMNEHGVILSLLRAPGRPIHWISHLDVPLVIDKGFKTVWSRSELHREQLEDEMRKPKPDIWRRSFEITELEDAQ